MRFSLIAWFLCLLIAIWTPFISISAQEKEGFPSELAMSPPDKLLEIYEGETDPTKLEAITEILLVKRESSIPVLRQALIEGTEKQKLISLSLLIEMQNKESGEFLINSLRDKSLKVQRRAAHAVGSLRYGRGYEHLVAMLETTRDFGLIKSVLAGLGMLGKKDALPLIRPWLNHSDSSVRVNAAISLAALGSEEAISEVIQATMSKDNQTRREATFGLGFFQDHRAHARLQEIIADPNATWKTDAEIALSRADLFAKSPLERLDFLLKLTDSPNKAVCRWAVDQISELGIPEAVNVLRSIASEKTVKGHHAKRRLLALGL